MLKWNINILFQQVDHMNPHPVLDSASEDMSVMTAGESTDIMASQCNTTTHMFVVTDNEVWMLQA